MTSVYFLTHSMHCISCTMFPHLFHTLFSHHRAQVPKPWLSAGPQLNSETIASWIGDLQVRVAGRQI